MRAVGVQRAEDQMPCFRRLQRDPHGFHIAHFADEDDVRVFAQGRPQRPLETLGVGVDLALVDEALLVRVHELDGVFNRNDVVGRCSLMKSMIAASVVDLPLPVGPVTSTKPFCRKQNFLIESGRPNSLKLGIFDGIRRNTAPMPLLSANTLQRKRPAPSVRRRSPCRASAPIRAGCVRE